MNISKVVTALSALGLMAVTTACAPQDDLTATGASAPRQCFNVDQVHGFSAPDRDTLLLNVGSNRTFKVETNGFCHDLDTAISIGLAPDLGSGRACTGDRARVVVPNSLSPGACRVRIIGMMTPEETAALKARND